LRDGYHKKEEIKFPSSIALIGMRNIRDFKIRISPESQSHGSDSPFNIAVALTLSDFTSEEVKSLYSQHTEATGQIFEDGAVERAMIWSGGQPWLVNALASEAIVRQLKRDLSRPVTADVIDNAAEAIKIRIDSHIVSLYARLNEEPVKRVMEVVLSGSRLTYDIPDTDRQYCLDLGLVKEDKGIFRIANLIYADVIVRTLTHDFQLSLPPDIEGCFFGPDGPDITALLKSFQRYWSGNIESTSFVSTYKECDAQFALLCYMNKAFNGSVKVAKEFATGSGRVDVCAEKNNRKYPVELKLKSSDGYTESKAVEQLKGYMNTCLASEAWLVVFDREGIGGKKTWAERLTWKTLDSDDGLKVHVVGC
jgi:hypothetical protein